MNRRGEAGSALVEVVWLIILLLVPLIYVVLAVFEVQRAAFAVSAASRSAGRAFVMAPTEGEAPGLAEAAANVTLRDHDLAADRRTLVVTCEPDPGNCLAPGSVVVTTTSYQVTLPLVPDALGGGAPSIRVESVHRVPYGTFREDRQ